MTEMLKISADFDTALYALPEALRNILSGLDEGVKLAAQEIRLRAGKPVCLTCGKTFYISARAQACLAPPEDPLCVNTEQLYEVLMRLTGKSVYTRAEELKDGYVSMKHGHRAGVCGRFTGGFFRDVSSVNIRIAKQVNGCAAPLYGSAGGGLLIAGSPGSGKTTVLRDLVRQLSDGGTRISVIDTRGEIAACERGIPCLDVGRNTDVLSGVDKARGTEIALRTLFPQFIAFDELGTEAELAGVRESFLSGVGIITTAHASSVYELSNRPVTRRLLDSGAVRNIALLCGTPGGKIQLISPKEVLFHA